MAGLSIDVEFDLRSLREAVTRFQEQSWPAAQREAVRRGMVAALDRTMDATPIDTGRARQGWGAAIAALGGMSSPSLLGNQPALSAGSLAGGDTVVTHEETLSQSAVSVENQVPYVSFLEYGTSRQAPHHMVDQGITVARDVVPQELLRGLQDQL